MTLSPTEKQQVFDDFAPNILFLETGKSLMNKEQEMQHFALLKEAFENRALRTEITEFIKTLYVELAMDEGDAVSRKVKQETIKSLNKFWKEIRKGSLQCSKKLLRSVQDKL